MLDEDEVALMGADRVAKEVDAVDIRAAAVVVLPGAAEAHPKAPTHEQGKRITIESRYEVTGCFCSRLVFICLFMLLMTVRSRQSPKRWFLWEFFLEGPANDV